MVDIEALVKALPMSGLEPADLAFIRGFVNVPEDKPWLDWVGFLEPPAGRRVPYINPLQAIETLLRGQGNAPDTARAGAREAVARMRENEPDWDWVHFYDSFDSESPVCLPVGSFVAWLKKDWPQVCRMAATDSNGLQSVSGASSKNLSGCIDIADFFERAAHAVRNALMLRGPDNWDSPYSLVDKPNVPPPKAMIEFVPGPPWLDDDEFWETELPTAYLPDFLRWRAAIRPIAEMVEKQLGEPVYYFADLDDELDDDSVHRFLVLHWCCSWRPESKFVEYLVRESGARDVDELKSALIDPASYTHAFKMNDAFFGIDPITRRFDYDFGRRKVAGVVFSTCEAREAAYQLLRQQIGAEALIVAPPDLIDQGWIDRATVNCRGWSVRYMVDRSISEPITVLANIDRLFVIADTQDRSSAGFGLQLSESAEILLWLAIEFELSTHYCTPDRQGLANPEMSLERRGVAERAARLAERRAEFTDNLKELRIYSDYGSSGLWDENGCNLSYDLLDLPFPLIRRIAAWQKDFDDTVTPPDRSDGAWWRRHEQEHINIADTLRAALEGRIAVVPLF